MVRRAGLMVAAVTLAALEPGSVGLAHAAVRAGVAQTQPAHLSNRSNPSNPSNPAQPPSDGSATRPAWLVAQPSSAKLTLYDLVSVSVTSAWAVGSDKAGDVLVHWQGSSWHRVQVLPRDQAFGAIGASSDQDVWALDFLTPHGGNRGTLFAEHLDGHRWTRSTVFRGDLHFFSPDGMFVERASDVWVVGYTLSHDMRTERPLAMHWTGTRWTRASLPSVPAPEAALGDVVASSPVDAVAVGFTVHSGGQGVPRGRTLVLQWDGRSWTREPSPNPGGPADGLYLVTDAGPSDPWALGARDHGHRSLVERMVGGTWRTVELPQLPKDTVLRGISGSAADDVWLVGSYAGNEGELHTLAMHWDGHAWRVTPTPSGLGAYLQGVATAGPGSAWAYGDTEGPAPVPLLRWDGTHWTRVR